eukprot:304954_1
MCLMSNIAILFVIPSSLGALYACGVRMNCIPMLFYRTRIGWVGSFVTLSPFYFVHHRYNRIVDTIGDEIDVLLHRFGIYLDLDAASYLDPYIITKIITTVTFR